MSALIRYLGLTQYQQTYDAMKSFTLERQVDSPDEIWLTEHYPVFTQGQAGKSEHLLNPTNIPLIQSDRGGQITYHGPGQIILYPLVDIKRAGIGIRQMVTYLEASVTEYLASFSIAAKIDPKAPGVYVDGLKIASLGLRVRNGRTYHGIAVNVEMDLAPFKNINPCGYVGLKMTQTKILGINNSPLQVGQALASILQQKMYH